MTAAAIRRVTEQYKSLVDGVNRRSDELSRRMTAVEGKFDAAIQRHTQVVDEMSVSVDEIEDLTNQLSNGGPPLEHGPSSPPHTDSNGVAVNNK